MDSEASNPTLSVTEIEEQPLAENSYEDLTYRIKSVYESCYGLVREVQMKKRGSLPRNRAAHIRRDRAVTALSTAESDLEEKEAKFNDMYENIELLRQQMVAAETEHQLCVDNNETYVANEEAAGEALRRLSMELHKYKVAWRMARKYVGNHFRKRGNMNNVKPNSTLPEVAKDENLISQIQSARKSYTELMRDIKRKIFETSKRRYAAYVRRNQATVAVSSSRYDLEQKGANLKAISERIQLLQQQQEVAQQELQLSLTNYYNCLDERDAAQEAFRQSLNDVNEVVGEEPTKLYHHYR